MLKPKLWLRPMVARDHAEGHRQASWLELLFDLSFVVAVAQAALRLEHGLAAGHVGTALIGYLVVFGAIWWAWMAFTWFANVFDCDDVPYRLLMIVMIAGSLGLAAGVPQIAELDFRVGVLSYVIMRVAYVCQWFRVWRGGDPRWRPIAGKMIVLTTFNQVGWVLFLWVPPEWKLRAFVVWFAVDLATPFLAGWDARMGGHRHHIVERYGLFTIIVLGEAIAAATIAIGGAISERVAAIPLLMLALGGLVVVCSLWWIYFDFSTGKAPASSRGAQLLWGYAHYFIFAAGAALGAGLALGVEVLTDPGHVRLPLRGGALLVGGAVAVFLLTVALIESVAEHEDTHNGAFLKIAAAAVVIAACFAAPLVTLPGSVAIVAMVVAAIVVYGVVLQHRLARTVAESPPALMARTDRSRATTVRSRQ
jgi:low temperature requirement protein LtrA